MFISRVPLLARLFLPKLICRLPTFGKKVVFLTFDDGPIPETTPFILDTLARHNIKATFFCVGENVKKNPELYKRILDEGHYVGNHSYNHLNGWKTPFDKYIENIEESEKVIHNLTPYSLALIPLFRPPYGKLSLRQYNVLKEKYKIIMWDVLTPDYDINSTTEECLKIVKNKTRNGSILVFHDNNKAKKNLEKLLPATIDFLLEQKFDIQPVTSELVK